VRKVIVLDGWVLVLLCHTVNRTAGFEKGDGPGRVSPLLYYWSEKEGCGKNAAALYRQGGDDDVLWCCDWY
jgi:hypothetical protein